MFQRIGTSAAAFIFLTVIFTTDREAHSSDRDTSAEIAPGTKLCDPAEDVYGFYLVKSVSTSEGTQEAEYYRFRAQTDPKTDAPEHILQRSLTVTIKRHPRFEDKLEVIDAATGEADEFLYAPCKK